MLGRRGYSDKPRATIPLGVDLEVFRPDREAGQRVLARLGWASGGPPVVGYLGRFIAAKGLPLLLDALDRLPEGTFRALFVGGGPLLEDLKRWEQKRPVSVRVLTEVTHDSVPEHLNAMDILAAPVKPLPPGANSWVACCWKPWHAEYRWSSPTPARSLV